jgi:hypothetical protein
MIFDLSGHREKLPLNLEAVIARDCSKVAGEFESIPLSWPFKFPHPHMFVPSAAAKFH